MDHQKQGKPKNKILTFLPKAASGIYFHNPPYSPTGDAAARLKAHGRRGFSGPLMIPDQVRRKQKSGSFDGQTREEEPTSPKVSCMGQIKHKKHTNKINSVNLIPEDRQKSKPPPGPWSPREIKKHGFPFRRMFSNINPGRKSESDASDLDRDRTAPNLPDRAPSLSQMKRFASGRGHSFENLDWESPHDIMNDHRDYSDEEREEREDVRIAFSAPLGIGGINQLHQVPLQPRKEINLWKRRTMAPPSPLELKPMVRAN
ncbi:hypothetical protein ACFX2I_016017 [Malus domestica]